GLGPAQGLASADEEKAPARPAKADKPKAPAAKGEKPADGKAARGKAPGVFPDIEELMKRLPPDLDERYLRMMRQQLEQSRQQLEQTLKLAERALATERWVRLGGSVSAPAALLADQLGLPRGQGLVGAAGTPDA